MNKSFFRKQKKNEHMCVNNNISCSIVKDDAYDKGEVNSRRCHSWGKASVCGLHSKVSWISGEVLREAFNYYTWRDHA